MSHYSKELDIPRESTFYYMLEKIGNSHRLKLNPTDITKTIPRRANPPIFFGTISLPQSRLADEHINDNNTLFSFSIHYTIDAIQP